jgi:hemerythrin
MRIEWNQSYLIGEPDIDRQHKHLFELINQVDANDDFETLRALMMQVYKHTREHFELEEAVMRNHNVPDVQAHTGYHNQLLGQLNEISAGFGKGLADKAALVELMSDWALRHIAGSDAVIKRYIQA